MKKFAKISMLTGLSLIALTVLIFLGAGLWVRTYGQTWAAKKLHEKWGVDISAQKVRTNFFNTIRVEDFRMSRPVDLSIEKAKFAFRPWNLLLPKGGNAAFHVELYGWTVRTAPSVPKKKSGSLPFTPIVRAPFPIGFVFQKGAVEVKLSSGSYAVQEIELRGRLSPFGARGQASALLPSGHTIHATAYARGLGLRPKFTLATEDVPVPDLLEIARLLQIEIPGDADGTLRVEADISGSKVRSFDVSTKNGKWRRDDGSPWVSINGKVKGSAEKLDSIDLLLAETVRVRGAVSDLQADPAFRLDVEGKEVSLGFLENAAGGTNWPVRVDGRGSFTAHLEGTVSNPQMTGRLELRPQINGIKLPDTVADISYRDKIFESSGTTSEGRMDLVVRAQDPQKIKGSLRLSDFSLERLAKDNGWLNVSGVVSTNVDWESTSKGPTIQGPFVAKGFSWGRLPPIPTLHGSVMVKSGDWQIKTSSDVLTFQAKRKGALWDVEQAQLVFGPDSFISAKGIVDASGTSSHLFVHVKNLPPDVWPPLVDRYPKITGGLDAEGQLLGRLTQPTFDLSILFHNLRFNSEGGLWNGTARAKGDSKVFSLADIHVDGGYTGRVDLKRDPIRWDVQLNFDQAQPQLMADLMNKSFTTTGTVTGNVELFYNKNWSGSAQVEWKDGSLFEQPFNSLSARAKFENDQILIDDLSWIQGSQALRGSAVIKEDANAWWNYDLTLQAQQFGPQIVKVDGELHLQGMARPDFSSVRGKLASSIIWINSTQVENLSLSYEKIGDWLTVRGGAAPFFDFQIRTALENGKLAAWFKGRSIKIANVLKSYFPTLDPKMIPEGTCNLSIHVSGKRSNPLVKAEIEVPEAKWRTESFKAEALIQASSHTLTVETARLELTRGGVLYSHGTVDLDQKGQMKLQGAADRLNLNALFHLLDLNLPWQGQADATYLIEGPSEARSGKFVFSSSHQGLSPFSGAGSIKGEAVLLNGQLDLSGVVISADDGYAKLLKGSQIFLGGNGSGALRLPLEVRNIHIGPLALFGGIELRGSWSGQPTSLLKPNESPVELEIFAQSLWVNQLLFEGNITHLTVLPGRINFSPIGDAPQRISGQLAYPKRGVLTAHEIRYVDNNQERVFLDGELGPEHWDFKIRLKDVDAAQLRGLLDTTLSLDGEMNFDLKGQGKLDDPIVSGTVEWKNGNLAGVPIDVATGKLEWKQHRLTLSNLEATRRRGYELTGFAQFGIGEKGEDIPLKLDLKIEDGDLAMLKDIWDDVKKAKGSFEGELKVDQHVRGSLKMTDIFLQTDSYIPVLKNGRLHLSLEDDKLTILDGHATLNDGKVVLAGIILFSNLAPAHYDLSLQTITDEGASIRVPELAIPPGAVLKKFSLLNRKLADVTHGDPTFRLTMIGPDSGPLLSGRIQLDNTFFTFPPPPQKKKPAPTMASRWLKSLVNRMKWDLVIETGERTRYENELVSARVNGSLQLLGPTTDLSVNGRITSNSGSLVYTGSEFKINEAVVEVITPAAPTLQESQRQTFVYLKANAEREVFYTDALGNSTEDTIVMAVDRSLLGEIQPRFYSKSNPNMSPQKAIKLALGLDLSDPLAETSLLGSPNSTQNSTDVNQALRVGLVQLLDSNLASPMARALARQTGLVDYIRVSYQQQDRIPEAAVATDGTTQNQSIAQNEWLRYMKGTKVKLGRELSGRLFADYSFKVDEYENQVDLKHEVELAYRVHRNLFLRATSELDSERTLGRPPDRRALLENQWRFDFHRRKKVAPPVEEEKKPTESTPGPIKG